MPTFRDSKDPTGLSTGHAPGEPSGVQSQEELELLGNLRTLYSKARDARSMIDRVWNLYQLYLKGDQLLYRDTFTGEYSIIPAGKQKRLYSINNQLRPTARSLVGKLSRVIPTFQVTPATAEQDEVYGARVADTFFEYFRRKENLDVKYIEMQEYLTWCGTAVTQLYWDPLAGDELVYCQQCEYSDKDVHLAGEECPVCLQFRQEALQYQLEEQQAKGQLAAQVGMEEPPPAPEPLAPAGILELITEGDIKVLVRDPRDVFVDYTARSQEELRWVVIRSIVPITEVRRKFPEKAEFVTAGSDVVDYVGARSFEQTLNISDTLSDSVVLYEYHEKPTFQFPEGRVIWFTGNVILKETVGYYKKFKRLPFFWHRWTVNQGEFWGESFVHQAWHRQKELNAVETTIRETQEMLSHPKVLSALGNRLNVDEISALTAHVITYNSALPPPVPFPMPTVPQQVYERLNKLPYDIRQAGTISEAESGVSPGDTAGRALAIVEAESNQQLGPTLVRNYAEWKDLHRCILIMARDFYSRDKKFAIAGEEGLGIYSFDDLRLSDSTDLQLEVDDGLSKNAAIRLTQGIDLANLGVYTDKRTGQFDTARFAKQARIKVPGVGIEASSSEYAAAQAMVKRIETGDMTAAQPSVIDDPVIFSEVILGWLRGKGRRQPNSQANDVMMRLYQYYVQWAMVGMMPSAAGPAQQGQGSQAGQDGSAPGGTANNPGHLESGIQESGATGRPMASEAQQATNAADKSAESAARVQQTREG